MAKLAIKGHATRGREIIELFAMMGGKNEYHYKGISPDVVLFIFEDRASMCKRWRELGFRCFQVADGDF